VFTIKGDGRYKARIVVKGFLQKESVDYDDIFAPVIRLEVLRSLLLLACLNNLDCDGMDVKTAFLNAPIDIPVYMKQPPGLQDPLRPRAVWLLKKPYMA
jgi:hypothetical protein